MQNSEREPFDKAWQSAFDGAEMAPPDRLWHSIEAELAGGETVAMKKRVVFYQRLAAATVLFAMLTGAYAIYNYSSAPGEVATTQNVTATPQVESSHDLTETAAPKASITDSNTNTLQAKDSSPRVTSTTKGKGNSSQVSGNTADGPPPAVALAENNPTVVEHQDERSGFEEVREPETIIARNERPHETAEATNETPKEEPTELVEILSADQINALAEDEAKKEKIATDRSPWLGVGAGAGSFAPSAVVSGVGFSAMDVAAPNYQSPSPFANPQSQSESVGTAYSAGVSGGLRLSKRWILQSGLNYINQQVDYSTNFVGVSSGNRASAMTEDYMSSTKSMSTTNDMAVTVTNPYEVNSATEILSIPVQAGYVIIDRKIGWQVNSGVSTDFLLRNTLTDKSGTRSTVTEGAGENSPYRTVNWAALLNTEISYEIGNHYRISLVPGMRYSFQPMLKESSGGTPLILDIGFRLKYLFN